jgi:hypothetical protein
VAKVKAARTQVPPQRRAAVEAASSRFEARLQICSEALEGGHERAMQREMPILLDLMEQEFPDEEMEVTDDQHAERMGQMRQRQMDLKRPEALQKTDVAEGPDCTTLHADKKHADWVRGLPGGIDALKSRIEQDQFTSIMFANEACMSEGAVPHVASPASRPRPTWRRPMCWAGSHRPCPRRSSRRRADPARARARPAAAGQLGKAAPGWRRRAGDSIAAVRPKSAISGGIGSPRSSAAQAWPIAAEVWMP